MNMVWGITGPASLLLSRRCAVTRTVQLKAAPRIVAIEIAVDADEFGPVVPSY